MKILITGATGFLGKAIITELGSLVTGTIGRSNCTFNVDLAREVPLVSDTYDYVIHAAGKAHSVPKTKADAEEFFAVNTYGTQNLLKGLEQSPALPKGFVFISSVAVYGREKGLDLDEETLLSAEDAYGKSKIEAEKIVENWCLKHGVICTIFRLPLLAGPNPPGNLAAMIKGIEKGYYVNIAGGKAKKSIVLAADVAKIVISAAQLGGTYNLTDGYNPSFYELAENIAHQLGKARPYNIPSFAANLIAKAGDLIGAKAPVNSNKLKKITSDLTFNDKKARRILDWKPIPVLKGFTIK